MLPESRQVAAVEPRYVRGSTRSEAWAHFHSGAVIPARVGRLRHYPGLAGEAPATLRYYRFATLCGSNVTHVVDAGCGAGEGLRYLSSAFLRATGVDNDPKALAFARQIAPEARHVQGDLVGVFRTDVAQMAVVVDVLGHLAAPEFALRLVAERLRQPGRLLVAEPRATPDQHLVAPARRAWSARTLHAVLVRGGWEVDDWLAQDGSFLVAVASPRRDPHLAALWNAEHQLLKGSHATSLAAVRQVRSSSWMPLRIEGLLLEARLELELGHRDAATAALSEARLIDAGDARATAGLSRMACLAGRIAEASSLAAEATVMDDADAASYCALALAQEGLESAGACSAWRTAHQLAPDDPAIVRHLCEHALVEKDLALAVTALERLSQYRARAGATTHASTPARRSSSSGLRSTAGLTARLVSALASGETDVALLASYLDALQDS